MEPRTANQLSASATSVAARWAVVALGAALLSGLWLRLALTWPALSGGANLLHAVHAHSHVAFLGWLVLGIASHAARHASFTARTLGQWRVIVHTLGVLSLVALVAFAIMGYAAPTIALSAVHVLLWIPLVRLLWPLSGATAAQRAWWRASFLALLMAGAATLLPAIFAARGIREGWWREFGIKLFLALFINGFAGFAALGMLSASSTGERDPEQNRGIDTMRWSRRAMIAALVPLAVLYVSTPPPVEWLVWVARGAVGVMAVGTAAVLVRAMQSTHSVWEWLALSAWSVVALLELVAAGGVGDSLLHQRPVTLAFTHLVLLLSISPVLAASLAPHTGTGATVRILSATVGGGVMCATLATFGWPWMASRAAAFGVDALELMTILAVVSAVTATAWWSMIPSMFRANTLDNP